MSKPSFPNSDTIPTCDQSIAAIIASIAAEEIALSHLITAESEKIQYFIGCAKDRGCTEKDMLLVLEANKSAKSMIRSIIDMQIVLKNKLALVMESSPSCIPQQPCPCPPAPPCPPTPPCPRPPDPPCPSPCPPRPPDPPLQPPCRCISVFSALTKSTWRYYKNLALDEVKYCEQGARLSCGRGETLILLPARKKFKVELDMKLEKRKDCSVIIEMEFGVGSTVIRREQITADAGKSRAYLAHSLIYETSYENRKHSIAVILKSPESVNILCGKVTITKL